MKLIADSGSTKCDWALIMPGGEVIDFKTMGFNPLFHNEEIIVEKLRQSKEIIDNHERVEEVFYYGAGSGSPKLKKNLQNVLKRVFSNAEVHSYSDLKAAAVATFDGSPGISCILGTGANSCFYDGANLKENSPALGYILGDEASGAFFGKKLLSGFLYKQIPIHLLLKIEKEYGLSKKEIIQNVYRKPYANVYLASFMPFFYKNKSESYIQKILRKGFRKFLLIHVLCFEECKTVPVHFVGSVAHFFREELQREAEKLNISVGRIVRHPIEGLKVYHQQSI